MIKNLLLAKQGFAGCLIILCLLLNPLQAEPHKASLNYQLPESQKIKLRVTKIPKRFPWVERDLDGKVELPEIGSTIIAENIEAIALKDPYGKLAIIKEGSKFYAEITKKNKAESFWRKGNVKLEFYKLELQQGQEIDISDMDFDSSKNSNLFTSGLKNIGITAASGLAGAVAAPMVVFQISSLAGLSLASNPMLAGSVAAIGGGIGISHGIKRKGESFIIEPGAELEIEIKEPWLIAQNIGNPSGLVSERIQTKSKKPNFKLNITQVKKSKDDFGDKCIKVSLEYENKTGQELRHSSFQLVDSMGKQYEPTLMSSGSSIFGKLPKQGKLNLCYTSEFPNTTHHLKVVRYFDRTTIASRKIVLR